MTLVPAHSMFWKLFIPVSLVLAMSAIGAAVFLPALVQRTAERDAIEAGQETAQQFKALRKYYTDNVVAKVLARSSLAVSFDHLSNPNTVPLPATMILDMSTLLRQSGTTLKLYSPYPFPNRRDRVLDKFADDAWVYFQKNPGLPFSRVEQVDGKTTVRVAIADRMTTPACIACHNSLASSPKKDWQIGDVRGVLEVDSSRQLESGERVVQQVLLALAAMMVLLALFLWYVYRRSIARPLAVALDAARALADGSAAKVSAVTAIANGDLEQELAPQRALPIDAAQLGKDEVGQLLQSVLSLNLGQVELDRAIRTMAASLRAGRRVELENDWHKTGQNELNTCMRGEQETAQLADAVLTYLAERVGASVGAFFLHDEASHELGLVAGYALPAGLAAVRIADGEGLVGQALREHRTIVVTEVPAGYLPVASSLGSADPASILVIPLQHGANLVGAIELGGFKQFSQVEQAFLDAAREALAISFEVNLARKRTEGLLSETEQQAEELRAQQEELQQSNEELEERAEMLERQREQLRVKGAEIEAASREIWNKAEQLQKVSAYKSEFMANMSHELRTPLNSMLILSGLLQENKGGQLSGKQVEYAATINGAGKDLLNLINDILDLSKVEAGQVEFQYEPCAPADLCRSIESLFHAPAEQKGLVLATSTAASVPGLVRVDVQRTLQVLKNLVGNAIKFTHAGGVTLALSVPEAADNPLPVPALAFAVTDTGIGVPDEKRDLIFEAFKQADGSVSRQYGGTGLGLSISLQLARRMGGALLMQSQAGQGSTFTLYLPQEGQAGAPPAPPLSLPARAAPAQPAAAPSASTGTAHTAASHPASTGTAHATAPQSANLASARSAAATPVPPSPAASGLAGDDRDIAIQGGKNILIVEDDLPFARILQERVRQRGFKSLLAHDGAAGIALANHFLPSAVLLDVKLPIIDGWGVMRSIKDNPATSHIPVHMLSGVESRRRAMELGALSFTPKPATIAELDAVLASVEGAPGSAGKKLLVVEDNAAEAAGIVALLAHHDVEITLATYGQQAIDFLSAGHYDCMVLDLGLADMPGFDVLTHLHSLAEGRRIPVIVHSGRELTREQERALRRYSESIIIKGAKSADRLLDEVTLFLHMVDAQLAPAPNGSAPAELAREARLEGKTVLVVDDDVRNIFSLSSLLADKGVHIVDAGNGREALERLAEHPEIEAVLMDIMMPEMDGYEAMRQIRANPAWRHLPVIAMTAKVMQGDQQKCIDAGASDYIAKPVDTAKLMTLLRVWTNH